MGVFVKLSMVVRGRAVVPPIPTGRSVHLPDDDDDGALEEKRDAYSGVGLFIEYVDSKGQMSARRVAVRRYDADRKLLHCWCFERSAPRAFKIERIRSASCPRTGEVYTDDVLMSLLRGGVVTDRRLRPLMTILVFLMRCDGHQHWTEVEALEGAATSFALRFDGDDQTVHQAVRLANALVPDADDFLHAMEWIARHVEAETLARFVLTHARAVIEADGRIAEEEIRFATELRGALRAIADGD